MKDIPTPLNATEKYLHATVIRLDAMCHMLSTIVEHLAEKDDVAVTNEEVKTNETVEEVTIDDVTQCQATTAKGTQCKRDALEGSKFCSTHQPKED